MQASDLRVVVLGASCAGKTTFARSLSASLGLPHVELDALHWGPEWKPRPRPAFLGDVETAISGRRWVVEGGYEVVRQVIWRRATTAVWLDYLFSTVFLRALRRTVCRSLTGEELYSGNRESLFRAFLTPGGIPWWVVRTYWRRRATYEEALISAEAAHLTVVRFRQPRDAEAFLDTLDLSNPPMQPTGSAGG